MQRMNSPIYEMASRVHRHEVKVPVKLRSWAKIPMKLWSWSQYRPNANKYLTDSTANIGMASAMFCEGSPFGSFDILMELPQLKRCYENSHKIFRNSIVNLFFAPTIFWTIHRADVILHSSSNISYLVTKIMKKTHRIKKILLQKKSIVMESF